MFKSLSKISKTSALFNKLSKKLQNVKNLESDNFLSGTNGVYVDKMYAAWRKDAASVHSSWDAYFSSVDQGISPSDAFQAAPTQNNLRQSQGQNQGQSQFQNVSKRSLTSDHNDPILLNIEDTNKVILLIRAFQRNGYLEADIDPLNQDDAESKTKQYKVYSQLSTLDYKSYGFTEADLEKEFHISNVHLTGIFSETKPLKLKEIISRLKKTYCSTIGAEFMHINSREECNFLREKFENEWFNYVPTKEEKLLVYDRLAWAVLFEEFLKSKFATHKRFGLEGLESMISGLKAFVDEAVNLGLKDITLGMAHRGRLNVLANVFRKPISKIFAEFQGKIGTNKDGSEEDMLDKYSGDVKYHLGTFYERVYPNGKRINLDILPNPSHLEAVNPVAMGKTRAKQHFSNDIQREDNICILIHGDAAFAGQGIIYESMQMSNLENFATGGVLHVIANNQIGFTTTPKDGRSTPFSTDIGKTTESPILHVNADDPIAVDFVFKIAAEYSRKFPKDIIVDVVGYRKMGHNELDQPSFTQPLMYQKINQKENVLAMYEKRLINEGGVTREELESYKTKIKGLMEKYYQDASNNRFEKHEWTSKQWENLNMKKYSAPQDTGVREKQLQSLGEKINTIPESFNIHPQIKKIYDARLKSVKDGKNIDWATAEALAFGCLLDEGYTIRLTGQDVERGTFSHRHAVLHDQKTDERYEPLKEIPSVPQNFQVHNSHLAEFAVLGFELGFSYYSPDGLVMWEAQFGDFANGAQIIIDQFISSGEVKWNINSGLTLLLPHGMDGQGPEHSSCRIERFLELMDDDHRNLPDIDAERVFQIQHSNMQVNNH